MCMDLMGTEFMLHTLEVCCFATVAGPLCPLYFGCSFDSYSAALNMCRARRLSACVTHPTTRIGNEALGLAADDEAKNFWLEFMPPNRVLPFDMKVPVCSLTLCCVFILYAFQGK